MTLRLYERPLTIRFVAGVLCFFLDLLVKMIWSLREPVGVTLNDFFVYYQD